MKKTKQKNKPFGFDNTVDQLLDKGVETGLENDPLFRSFLAPLSLEENVDPDIMGILVPKINTRLQQKKLDKKIIHPFKPYPTKKDFNAKLDLATVKVGEEDKGLVKPVRFRIHPFDVLSGVMIGGKPKSGKTTFIIKLILVLLAHIKKYNMDTSIWIFDNKKDFLCLTKYFPEALIYDSSNMFLSLLEYLEVVGKQKSINTLVEVLCNILYLMEGSSSLLSAGIEELFQIYEGTGVNPTINDLIAYLSRRNQGKSSRVNEYRGSITNRIEGILASSGDIFNVSRGLNFEEDLANRRLVIFSLHDMTPVGQALMTMVPILRLFNYRIARGERYNYPRNIFIFDEAKRIFPKRAEFSHSGASVSTKLFLESREFGFSFIISDHMINELSNAVQNAFTRVMFRLADYTIPEVAKNLYLTREQAEYFFHLKQGEAIVRYDRFPYPFVIETDNVMQHIDKNISQEEIEQRMKPFWDELKRNVQPAKPEILDEYFRSNKKGSKDIAFDQDSVLLLNHAYNHYFNTILEHYKDLGLSASKGNAAVKELEDKRLITKVPVKAKKRGRKSILLNLTSDGLKALNKIKQPFPGKGSIAHSFYVHKIEQWYIAQGVFKTKKEYLDCDLVIETPDGLIGVEITLHLSNMEKNIQRNKDNGFIKTILVFEDNDAMDKARAQLGYPANVSFKLIDFYLE